MFTKSKLLKPVSNSVNRVLVNKAFNQGYLFLKNNQFYSKSISIKYFTEKASVVEEELRKINESEVIYSKKDKKTKIKVNSDGEAEDTKTELDKELGKTIITSQLLCQLIGTKHYPINEEIHFDKYTIVKCFNENDVNLGTKTLAEIQEEANELGKDVVLRNDKKNPPIVKVMRYKIELLKRLLRKLSKNKEFKLNEAKSEKLISFPIDIEEGDMIFKTDKCRELLKHFSHLKIAVFCDVSEAQNEYKASTLLNHIAESLSDVAKISIPVKISYKTKSKEANDEEGKVIVNPEDAENIYDREAIRNKDVKIGREKSDDYKNLEYNDSFVIELESMLIDTSGIDYEQMLESNTIEDIFAGIKNDKFKKKLEEKEETEEAKEEDSLLKELEQNELEQKKLEQELEFESDIVKKIMGKRRLAKLRGEITFSKNRIIAKNCLKKVFQDFKIQTDLKKQEEALNK